MFATTFVKLFEKNLLLSQIATIGWNDQTFKNAIRKKYLPLIKFYLSHNNPPERELSNRHMWQKIVLESGISVFKYFCSETTLFGDKIVRFDSKNDVDKYLHEATLFGNKLISNEPEKKYCKNVF